MSRYVIRKETLWMSSSVLFFNASAPVSSSHPCSYETMVTALSVSLDVADTLNVSVSMSSSKIFLILSFIRFEYM